LERFIDGFGTKTRQWILKEKTTDRDTVLKVYRLAEALEKIFNTDAEESVNINTTDRRKTEEAL
jgi:hypothetical protein